MTWMRIPDDVAHNLVSNPISNPAIGLWIRAKTWTDLHHTGGHLPADIAAQLAGRTTRNELIRAGLFEPDGDGFHVRDLDRLGRLRLEQPRTPPCTTCYSRPQLPGRLSCDHCTAEKRAENLALSQYYRDNPSGTWAPSRYCCDHPDGPTEPCPACDAYRQHYEAWKAARLITERTP